MSLVLPPWHLMAISLASWINRKKQEVIEYLRSENQVLKEKLGKKRILLNDDQRRRLAVKGKFLGRNYWNQSERGLRPTPFSVGIHSWSPGKGTTLMGRQGLFALESAR